MADLDVTVDDLAVFVNDSSLDQARGQLMLDAAVGLCATVVSPVPETAKGVVLGIAARALANPEGVTGETVGAYSVQRPAAGVYLLRGERTALKALAGRGGAFTIDPTPTDAGTLLDPWNTNATWLNGVPLVDQP